MFREFIQGLSVVGILFFAIAGGYLLHPALLIAVWFCFAFVNVADKHKERRQKEIQEYLKESGGKY